MPSSNKDSTEQKKIQADKGRVKFPFFRSNFFSKYRLLSKIMYVIVALVVGVTVFSLNFARVDFEPFLDEGMTRERIASYGVQSQLADALYATPFVFDSATFTYSIFLNLGLEPLVIKYMLLILSIIFTTLYVDRYVLRSFVKIVTLIIIFLSPTFFLVHAHFSISALYTVGLLISLLYCNNAVIIRYLLFIWLAFFGPIYAGLTVLFVFLHQFVHASLLNQHISDDENGRKPIRFIVLSSESIICALKASILPAILFLLNFIFWYISHSIFFQNDLLLFPLVSITFVPILLILFLISFFSLWRKKYAILLVPILVIVTVGVYLQSMALATLMLIAYVISRTLVNYFEQEWELLWAKFVVVSLILMMILTSFFLFYMELEHLQVSQNMQESIFTLRNSTGFVLTHPSYAPLIEYYANVSVINSQSLQKNQIENLDDFWKLNVVENITQVLNTYQISTVYVTPQMRQGLVWKKPRIGLQIILENENYFEKIYDKDIVIYRVKSQLKSSAQINTTEKATTGVVDVVQVQQ